jgi:anti-anti-sigma factor
MLKVDIKSASPAVTLFCAGRMTLGVEAETLRCVATSRSERHVLLEMSKVHGIDAAGLGLLVELHHWARRRSANMVIVNPSPRTRQMIALTGLDQVLNVSLPVAGFQSADTEDSMCMTA